MRAHAGSWLLLAMVYRMTQYIRGRMLVLGSLLLRPQDDKSTPVHFAAAQGNLDMIKLMHTLQEDNFQAALYTTDAMNMTPLHRAALFNHKAVLTFLLEQVRAVPSLPLQHTETHHTDTQTRTHTHTQTHTHTHKHTHTHAHTHIHTHCNPIQPQGCR